MFLIVPVSLLKGARESLVTSHQLTSGALPVPSERLVMLETGNLVHGNCVSHIVTLAQK